MLPSAMSHLLPSINHNGGYHDKFFPQILTTRCHKTLHIICQSQMTFHMILMHSCKSNILRDIAIPHLHTAYNSKNCSTGIPGRDHVSSLHIISLTASSALGGGSYHGITTTRSLCETPETLPMPFCTHWDRPISHPASPGYRTSLVHNVGCFPRHVGQEEELVRRVRNGVASGGLFIQQLG